MKLVLVLLLSTITWYNMLHWFPILLTNMFVMGPLLIGNLFVIIGALIAHLENH